MFDSEEARQEGLSVDVPAEYDPIQVMHGMKAMWVMIAGPYRSGAGSEAERLANLGKLNAAAYAVLCRGHVPIVGVNLALPIIAVAGEERYDEIMMPLSLAAAERCDAVLRVGGPSRGADEEVERIRARGGSVYERVEDLPHVR